MRYKNQILGGRLAVFRTIPIAENGTKKGSATVSFKGGAKQTYLSLIATSSEARLKTALHVGRETCERGGSRPNNSPVADIDRTPSE